MEKHLQIRELQEKAFNGDKDALGLYQEYVNRGEAPAIRIKESAVRDAGDMYKDTNTFKRSSMYGDVESRRDAGQKLSSIEKMMLGYSPKQESAKADTKELDDLDNKMKATMKKVDEL